MRVLITGGTGFIGRAVVAEAAGRGAAVGLLVRSEQSAHLVQDTYVLGKQRWSTEAIEEAMDSFRPDAVLHLVGGPAAESTEELYEANVFLGLRIIEAARTSAPSARILCAGSAAEYGPPVREDGRASEDDYTRPLGPYGISKLAQTLHAMAAARRGQSIVVARVFNPVGSGMPPGLAFSDFAQKIANGETRLLTGDIDTKRDFMPVGEAARIIVDLVSRNCPSQIVNVCSGRPQTVRSGLEHLISLAGRSIQLGRDPAIDQRGGVRCVFGETGRLRDIGIAPASSEIRAALGELLLSYQHGASHLHR